MTTTSFGGYCSLGRCLAAVLWLRGGAPLFRLSLLDAVITAGDGVTTHQRAHRAHIGHQLPHLRIVQAAAERRHAVWPAFYNGRKYFARLMSVNPFVIHQWRADPPAAMRVAARAIEPVEQLLALRYGIGGFLVGPARLCGWRG